jgi:hypothetical protein
MNTFSVPQVFRPSLLKAKRNKRTRLFPPNAAPVVREGRLVSDNTMPARDWRAFDKPAFLRMTSKRVRNVTPIRSFAQAG